MMVIRIFFVISLLFISFNILTSSRPLFDAELEDGVESFHGFLELPSRDDRKPVEDATTISENSELKHDIIVNRGPNHCHHCRPHGHRHHHRHRHRQHGKPGKRHHQPRKPPRRKAPVPAAPPPAAIQADIVVAQDGSGNFRTINDAVTSVGRLRNGGERFTIHVKAGTYTEYVDIPYDMENVTMIGDGIGKTILTGNKFVSSNVSTPDSRTFGVFGNGFVAQGITFRNTAGRQAGRAVALMSLTNHSVFYRCSFEGYQDTLYINRGIQFFKECDIYGTVDMIFGDPTAILQHCHIYLRHPQYNVLTIVAQKRESPDSKTGIVIQNSTITTDGELSQMIEHGSTMRIYLGRPWGNYSRTVVINTFLENIDSEGWLGWDVNPDLVYYAEFGNSGPGSTTSGRVKWKGFHIIDEHQVLNFTVGSFLQGDDWLPATKVPYASGL
ncbi:pectinesterase 2-like [Dorcoceras hygrometricum]|uniref:pectinesterase n=1 Tax=Dorcoceras hygrometricum TaxID=472368 RepID=A0A2Z7BYY4_9LAMI|nr:pectinesterase 2-like [Dorcoceras hygrometricum]